MKRRRIALFVSIVWLLVVGAAEVGLRLADLARGISRADRLEFQRTKYTFHPSLGHRLRPGHEGTRGGRVTVGAQGYRGGDPAVPKPRDTYRILCLGGSTTFGPLLDDDQTYPARLETALRERYPGRAIEVVNGGSDGYTSAESLINLALRGLDLEPDLVIVYHGINDLRPSWFEPFASDYSHVGKLFAPTFLDEELRRYQPLRSLMQRLLEHSRLYLAVSARLRRPSPDEHRQGDRRRSRAPEAPLPSEATLARNLRSLIAVARAHGVEVLLGTFVLYPESNWPQARKNEVYRTLNPYYRPPASLDELIAGIERHNEVVRAVANATSAPLVEAAREMSREESLFLDECHTTVAGSDELARIFAAGVVRGGFLGSPGGDEGY